MCHAGGLNNIPGEEKHTLKRDALEKYGLLSQQAIESQVHVLADGGALRQVLCCARCCAVLCCAAPGAAATSPLPLAAGLGPSGQQLSSCFFWSRPSIRCCCTSLPRYLLMSCC